MSVIKNITLPGADGRAILMDYFPATRDNAPLMIFCHGYKGFKDWGFWQLMGQQFAGNGIACLNFNFSHNGGTPEQPLECPDPEAFALNNFTKELFDLHTVINWVSDQPSVFSGYSPSDLFLMGHSRGGGIALIKAAEDPRIKKVITLGGVSDFRKRFAQPEALAYWKAKGVIYIENARTGQQLPHYYQFYEDFEAHEERLTISRAIKALEQPCLILHGTEDTTVLPEEANDLKTWNGKARLHFIEGANHVFGGVHPWEQDKLPLHMEQAMQLIGSFLDHS